MTATDSAVASEGFAELLQRQHHRLKTFVEEWSEQQERIIASASKHDAEKQRPQSPSSQPASSQPVSKLSQEQPSTEKLFLQWPVAEEEEEVICESSMPLASVEQSHLTQEHCIMDLWEEAAGIESTAYSKFLRIQQAQKVKYQLRRHVCIQRLVKSPLFEWLSILVIFFNAIFMAYSVDYAMKNPEREQSNGLMLMELAFSCYYLVEIILRLLADQWYFFFEAEAANWNIFDLLLVVYSVAEVVMDYSQQQDGGISLGFLRAIRICKILKVLRIVRVLRSLRELRLIISSLTGSVKTLFWSLVLIMAMTFMFALFLMQPLTQHMTDHPGSLNPELQASVDKYWSSVLEAMTSLYMSCTGGESWSNIAKPLKLVSEPFYYCFLAYVAFFMFVLVNALASIFIEATMVNAEKDDKAWIRDQMKKKHSYIKLIKRLFASLDADGRGNITRDDFIVGLENPQMIAFLNRIGIDEIDAIDFFDFMSPKSGQEGIDIDKFVVGCMKLKGNARSMDLQGLIHKHDLYASRLVESAKRCESALRAMQKQCSISTNRIMEFNPKAIPETRASI